MYKCKTCGELFYSIVDCQKHLENQHADSAEGCLQVQYRCAVCGQIFGHRTDVKNHALRDHGQQRPRYEELVSELETGD